MSWRRRERELRLAQQRRKNLLAEADAEGRVPREALKVERLIKRMQQAGQVSHG